MGLLSWLRQDSQLKKMVLIVVFIALFLDHMLLSVVVPILPSYLYGSDPTAIITPLNSSGSAVSPPVVRSHSNRSACFAHPHQHPAPTSDSVVAPVLPDSNCSEAGSQLDDVNIRVGLLLASKSTVQLICNPFIGPLTDRIGYHIPMCAGFCIIVFATTLFAFSSSYVLLLLARSVQGVAGSCLSVAGMAMLTDTYKDEKERGRAMGISFSGLALGLIGGAPFGSVMYQFVGKMSPFLVLAVIAVLGGGLHSLIFQPSRVQTEMEKGTSLLTLLKDPYILIAAGAICFTTFVIAVIEAALPVWMMKTMHASKWQLGIVFLPDSVSYLIASNIFGHLSQKHRGSWLCACIGMIVAGITTICFRFSKNIYHLLVLNAFIGFSVGMVDSSIMPLMGTLVDLRHRPVYGTVYAIADVAICIGFCVGPAMTGPIVASIGFPWLMGIIGAVNIIFAPLCIFLLTPTQPEERLLQNMEEHVDHAKVTNGLDVLHILSPENCDIDILDNGTTIEDFMDIKTKELARQGNEEPFFVANLDSMFKRHLKWLTSLPRVKPYYAVKCNNTPAVVQTLRALGTGFDCASKGEIQLALSLGVAPDKIIYAHTTKPRSHIKYACAHGVNMMTFDSEDELLKISICHPKTKLILRIAVDDSKSLLRLNLKFGAKMASVARLLERAAELDFDVIGVSFHVGSGCTECASFKQAIADARQVFDIANLMGFQMSLLDIGGGFSGREDFQVKFEEFSEVINGALEKYFPPDSGVQIIAEPGRYYVESAFTLAANIMARRVVTDEMEELCNSEENSPERIMMYYLNDGVYGSLSCLINDAAHTAVEPYLRRTVDSSEKKYRTVIWGPTCDCLDKVTDSYLFPELQVGDWLFVDHMGAYSVSLTTDFNGFERAHIYSVVTAEIWQALKLSNTYDIIHD
uniref:synaptic vesicular amine transporter-like n=1 Tax=Semicossyphus pulcher TaxID=241346 RepID=UPI0037E76F41